MRSTQASLTLPIVLAALILPAAAHGQTPPKQPDNPYPYAAEEPKANGFSLAKGADYLDGVARFWMRSNSCGACHANFAYVMARPVLKERSTSWVPETRDFLEARKPDGRFGFHTYSVGIAFSLAWDDARAGDKLQPATLKALRRMWTLQRADGTWGRLGCGDTLPSENDRHYTMVLAALATAVAPEEYARRAEAQDGLTKLRRYFAKYSPRNLHDHALVLWASLHLDGLMTAAERVATIKALLARQEKDGGWSFAGLTDASKPPTVGKSPSDGYSTAFSIYVLRQAGVSATRPEISRGVRWLRDNQRASGRWFTPSHAGNDPTEGGVGTRGLYVQNLGTAFALLALKACEESSLPPMNLRAIRPQPGLSLRNFLILD